MLKSIDEKLKANVTINDKKQNGLHLKSVTKVSTLATLFNIVLKVPSWAIRQENEVKNI